MGKRIKIVWQTDKVKFIKAILLEETDKKFIVRPLDDTRIIEITKSAVIEVQYIDGRLGE